MIESPEFSWATIFQARGMIEQELSKIGLRFKGMTAQGGIIIDPSDRAKFDKFVADGKAKGIIKTKEEVDTFNATVEAKKLIKPVLEEDPPDRS